MGGPPITMLLRRIIALFYLLVFTGLIAGAGVYFWQTRQELKQQQATEARIRQRLSEAETRLKRQQEELVRLRTDPAYVELVIRRRLGYAKPGELIFRFEN